MTFNKDHSFDPLPVIIYSITRTWDELPDMNENEFKIKHYILSPMGCCLG